MTTTPWPTYKFDHTFADFNKFDKYFVGADKFFDRLKETHDLIANTAAVTYPPFNLKKTDDNVYVLEMAVAGFAKQDIELTLEDNKLKIAGKVEGDDAVTDEYLHKGISARPFQRSFVLNDNVVVNNAQYINGLLKIWLEHIIPDDKKPKKINIEDTDSPAPKGKKQFLAE